MPIMLSCPSCGGKLSVADNLAGRKVKCPKCATVIAAPTAGDDGAAIQASPPTRPAAAPASAPPPPTSRRRPADDDDDEGFQEDTPKRPAAAQDSAPPAPRRKSKRDDRDDYDDDYSDDASYDRDEPVRAPRSGGGVNGLAVAGMVLGIVGFLMVFIPCIGWLLGIVLGIVGAVLSGIGLASASKAGGGKGMAIAGLVLSILAIVWVPIYVFIVLSMLTAGANQAIQAANQAANNPQIFFKDKGIAIQPGKPQGPPTPASGKLTLEKGQATIQGNLAANDPRDRVHGLSACKVYTITLVAGKTYQIDMVRSVPTYDPFLRLEDAAGTNLAEDDDGGGNRDARINFTCTANGEYRIVATSLFGGTGGFSVQVSEK